MNEKDAQGRTPEGRGRARVFGRREFIAGGIAAGLGVLGLGAAGGTLTAAPKDPAAPLDPPRGGAKRSFVHRGKKVEIVEDARGADLAVDGKKVRAKKVSGMYRTPGFAFLPAHTPEELAKGLIDYELALEAKAAGKAAAGAVGANHAGGH